MSGIVDTESTINFNDGTYDFTGGNTAWAGFVPNGQQFGGTPVPDGSDDLLLTPVGVGTTINGNANSAGVSGGGNRTTVLEPAKGSAWIMSTISPAIPQVLVVSTIPPIATLSLRTTMR